MNYNFEEKYDELFEKNKLDLDKVQLRSKIPMPIIVIGIILLLPILLILGPIGIIIGIAIVFVIGKKGSKYTNLFKERITNPLLREIHFVEEIDPLRGIDEQIYKKADFRDSDYDQYGSVGYIGGKIENAKMEFAEAWTTKIHTSYDEEGKKHETRVTTFNGLVIAITSEKFFVNGYIHIFSDKDDKSIFKFREKEEKVHMDSMEFEENFDVYASDPIKAMEILTSDTMQRLIEEKQIIKDKYEISITENFIIVRIFDNSKSLFNIRTTKTKPDERAQQIKMDLLNDLNYLANIEQFMTDISKDIHNKV